jgi:hypothetical protein
MEYQPSSPSRRPENQRQRSNSFPIVEALGCSTPEAQLLMAEGRAAVRKRRARGRRNRSFDDEETTVFDPRDHMRYLQRTVDLEHTVADPLHLSYRNSHGRFPSNATDRSTSTIVALPRSGEAPSIASPTSPLGNYSAHLAQFIKDQLKSIPTYQSEHEVTAPLSPRSCPDFSFPPRTPLLSPKPSTRRPTEAPTTIHIPAVRPPMQSAFSEWSSTDDDTPLLSDMEQYSQNALSSNYAPSVLGYYEGSSTSSFLFSFTPLDDQDPPDTAKTLTFPIYPEPAIATTEPHDDNDSASSSFSRPQLSTSAPSYSSSSASASSYFDLKRPLVIAPQLKDRIIAALTPPHQRGKMITAISPWEGGALANVHDVYVESQHRVHVDGMSFDMLRGFIVPSRITTPC